jgi:hypothetical protein
MNKFPEHWPLAWCVEWKIDRFRARVAHLFLWAYHRAAPKNWVAALNNKYPK